MIGLSGIFHVGVEHTNSVASNQAKVFQSLLLTGNSFQLLVFGSNLIAWRCQCSLARRATAIARSQSTSWSLARHRLRHSRRYCPAGELALSPPPSPGLSLQTPASSHASAGELSWQARLPAPSRLRLRLLAITAIAATQACSPSAPRCMQLYYP